MTICVLGSCAGPIIGTASRRQMVSVFQRFTLYSSFLREIKVALHLELASVIRNCSPGASDTDELRELRELRELLCRTDNKDRGTDNTDALRDYAFCVFVKTQRVVP